MFEIILFVAVLAFLVGGGLWCKSYIKKHIDRIEELQNTLAKVESQARDTEDDLETKLQEWEDFYNNDITPMATKAGEKLKAWSTFYSDTLDDVNSVIGMLERLMERETVSSDPDVQNLMRVVAILHDILKNYVDVGVVEMQQNTELIKNVRPESGATAPKSKD